MRIAAFVCCLFLMLPVSARAADGGFTVLGSGNDTCDSWTWLRGMEATNSFEAEIALVALMTKKSWVHGYVAGRAHWFWATRGVDFAKFVDGEGLFAWIDNYCAANPRESIFRAAEWAATDLQNRAVPR